VRSELPRPPVAVREIGRSGEAIQEVAKTIGFTRAVLSSAWRRNTSGRGDSQRRSGRLWERRAVRHRDSY